MKRLSVLLPFIAFFLLCPTVSFCSPKAKRNGVLKLKINGSGLSCKDTLILRVTTLSYPTVEEFSPNTTTAVMQSDGNFHFLIHSKYVVGYFSICKIVSKEDRRSANSMAITPYFLWQSADDMTITINKYIGIGKDSIFHKGEYYGYEYFFRGQGAHKYRTRLQCDSARFFLSKRTPDSLFYKNRWYDAFTNRTNIALIELEKHKRELGRLAYEVLKADYLFERADSRFYDVSRQLKSKLREMSIEDGLRFMENYFIVIDSFIQRTNIDPYYLSISKEFDGFVLKSVATKLDIEAYLRKSSNINNEDHVYATIKAMFTGILRDKILCSFLQHYKRLGTSSNLYRVALNDIRSEEYREVVQRVIAVKGGGATAYDFSLPDASGQIHNLLDYRGKIIVMDFWFTGCGGCSALYKTVLMPTEDELKQDNNVVFVTISADVSRDLWLKGLLSEQYAGSRSVNLYTQEKGAFHPIFKHYNVGGYPTVLVIGQDGRIIRYYNSVSLREKNTLVSDIKEIEASANQAFAPVDKNLQ